MYDCKTKYGIYVALLELIVIYQNLLLYTNCIIFLYLKCKYVETSINNVYCYDNNWYTIQSNEYINISI